MKNYLLALAAVLCCAMATTVFTACGDDDDDSEFGEYYAETDGLNMQGEVICAEMDQALSKAFGNQTVYKLDDSKAIRTCDEVANKHKSDLAGTVNLKKRFGNTDSNASGIKIIKTYEFPY